jgi:hypothetical protein
VTLKDLNSSKKRNKQHEESENEKAQLKKKSLNFVLKFNILTKYTKLINTNTQALNQLVMDACLINIIDKQIK